MAYFKNFRKENYIFDENVTKVVTNISKYTGIFDAISEDTTFYTYYTMNEVERLDSISSKVYGTPDFYWTIPLINNSIISTWKDLPRNNPQQLDFLKKKYVGQSLFMSVEDILKDFILDENVYISTNPEVKAKIVDFYPTLGYVVTDSNVFNPISNNATLIGEESGVTATVTSIVPYYEAPYLYKSGDDYVIREDSQNLVPITIRQIEDYSNTQRTQIKVIRPDVIYDIVDRFEKVMKSIGSRI